MRLYRRRKNGRPHGAWIAWGFDAAGQRWSESTHQHTRAAAEDVARDLERRRTSPADAAREAATLANAVALTLAEYTTASKRGTKSDSTKTYYEQKTGHWRRTLGDAFKLAKLDAPTVDRAVTQRRAEGASEHTIHKEVGALRRVLKIAKRAGLWSGDPGAVLPEVSAEYVPRARWVSLAELQQLLAELPSRDAARVAWIVATGARDSEADRASAGDAKPAPDVGYVVRVHGKKTRASDDTVAVVTPAAVALLEYALEHATPEGGRLFPARANTLRTLKRACVRLDKRLRDAASQARAVPAGEVFFAPLSPNDLRRSCAQWLCDEGVALEDVARQLRHATPVMVYRVYGKRSGAQLAKAIGRAADMQHAGANPVATVGTVGGSVDAESPENSASDGGSSGDRTQDRRIKSPPVIAPKPLFPKPRVSNLHASAAHMQQRAKRGAR